MRSIMTAPHLELTTPAPTLSLPSQAYQVRNTKYKSGRNMKILNTNHKNNSNAKE